MDSDGEYEVTADMLIHEDIDDERTLEEEEDDILKEDQDKELSDLQKEGDMPLEELLATYYRRDSPFSDDSNGNDPVSESLPGPSKQIKDENKKAEVLMQQDRSGYIHTPVPLNPIPDLLLPPGLMEDITPATTNSNLQSDIKYDQLVSTTSRVISKRKGPWFRPGANLEALARLRPVPERRSMKMYNGNEIIDTTFNTWLSIDSRGGDDSSDDDYEWRQEIRVGSDHQAIVPEYPTCTPYLETINDELLWSPHCIPDNKVDDYIYTVNCVLHSCEALPSGVVNRDNEHALNILKSCDYSAEKSLALFGDDVMASPAITPWTEDECRKFEAGLRLLGKDFHALHKQIPSRSVKELVEFYYLWKKTERYDVFSQFGKFGKKKFTLQPGYMSDFMDDYLDPPEPEFADLHYGSTTLNAEIKKDRTQQQTQHIIQIDEQLRHMQKPVTAKSS